jgi:2-dehydropantoate 2-reductase
VVNFRSVAIVGAGAIGGYYGARMALAGVDVRFLLRSELAHVRAHGLTLRERDATRRLERVAAFATADEIGPVDVVLVTLKTTANPSLTTLLPPLGHASTVVVTLQNGLGNDEVLADIVGAKRVMGGLCIIGVTREAPGEIVGYRSPGAVVLGEFGRSVSERLRALGALFERAGVEARLVENLAEARWRKLVWNVPFNGLSITAGGISTDQVMANPNLVREVRALMGELADAGKRLGFDVSEEFIQSQIDVTSTLGAYRPSSLVDFLAGRAVEIEPIWGEPLRRGLAAGAAMPRLSDLYHELLRLTGR